MMKTEIRINDKVWFFDALVHDSAAGTGEKQGKERRLLRFEPLLLH